jgi:CelD/BcsL family acetyltransferase involved in cellulose biosynthesis
MVGEPFTIDVARSAAEFDALRARWETLYESDPQARIFQSWSWVRGLAASQPAMWSVLVVRPRGSSAPVALLPLGADSVRFRGLLVKRVVHTGGRLGDSTGLVCAPGFEEAVIPALAAHVRSLKPDQVRAFDVADVRLRRLIELVADTPEHIERGKVTSVPFISLPGDWEVYLREKLSSRRREDLRRAMRAVAALPSFRMADVTESTFDADFAVLMRLRQARWGGSLERDQRLFYPVMRRMFDDGRLWLRALWSGVDPIAIIGGFPDRAHGIFWYYWGSFNAAYAKISPGKASFGIAIRHVIEQGFQTFSMTYGEEAYKATFGTEEGLCEDLAVDRPSLRSRVVSGAVAAGARLKRAVAGAGTQSPGAKP